MSAPTVNASPTGDTSFFAHTGTQRPDTFTAANQRTYWVRADGRLVRIDGTSRVDMPVVGAMLGRGVQSRDHDATIATVQVTGSTTRAEVTFLRGTSIVTARALQGVVVDGHHYAVFVITPAVGPDAVQSVSQTDASGHGMTAIR